MIGLDPNAPAAPAPGMPLPPPTPTASVGGIMPIMSASQVEAEERRAAQLGQEAPAIQGLASHVRKLWTVHRQAKEMTIEQRMLGNVRMRRGEYDPSDLASIRKQGGSEIYMMVGSTKCRAAGSWLRDVIVAVQDEKPWTLKPSPVPDLPPQAVAQIKQQATQQVAQLIMSTGVAPTPEIVRNLLTQMRDQLLSSLRDEANARTARMEDKMEDQLLEGGFLRAVNDFIDDLTTFPTAIIKGPIVRRKPTMKWVEDPTTGEWTLDYKDDLTLEWERVDPFNFYPHPALTDTNEALPVIEKHRLTRTAITEMKGVEGYDDAAIDAVLDEYGKGGLHEWLRVDTAKATAEGRSTMHVMANPEGTIDALQFFGPVQGRMLREWGMSDEEVPDASKEYHCEVWLIGQWVIKATLNYDPLGRKPYYCTSYEKVPGVFWGNSVLDLCRDSQKMCNAAARAIANNMGISSGPQAFVNVDRLPTGEDVTEMFPWKIWQTTSDPMGGTGDPIKFFQPQINAQELMTIFERFSVRADEDTGVPRYMTGESPTGGAGRTASGLSMLLGNASKTIKQVVSNVDVDVLTPVLERLYHYNMKYSDDPELKGDINIIARGATSIMLKESAQVRRNEFLAMVGQSPLLSQIVGPEGIAELVREAAKTLDMPNVDKIVPDPERLRQMAQLQQAAQGAQAQQATPPGINNGGQDLMNGAPATDNF